MNQNKHTPGQWGYTEDGDITTPFDEKPVWTIAFLCDGLPDGQYEANRSLIAAAPDLLEGLKKMLSNEEQRDFENWRRNKTPSGDASDVQAQWLESSDYEDFLEGWKLQIDAIAKARGEQP